MPHSYIVRISIVTSSPDTCLTKLAHELHEIASSCLLKILLKLLLVFLIVLPLHSFQMHLVPMQSNQSRNEQLVAYVIVFVLVCDVLNSVVQEKSIASRLIYDAVEDVCNDLALFSSQSKKLFRRSMLADLPQDCYSSSTPRAGGSPDTFYHRS